MFRALLFMFASFACGAFFFNVAPPHITSMYVKDTFLGIPYIRSITEHKAAVSKNTINIGIADGAINEDSFQPSHDGRHLIFGQIKEIECSFRVPDASACYRQSVHGLWSRHVFLALLPLRADINGDNVTIKKGYSFSQIPQTEAHLQIATAYVARPCIGEIAQFRIARDQIWPVGIAHDAALFDRGECRIAGGVGRLCRDPQRPGDERESQNADPQLPKRIIRSTLGSSGHALLFTQVGLAVIVGIAAWGPIFWGLGLILFGRPRIPSDFLLTPRFLIGWRKPKLVGFISFCGGLLLIGGGVWLTWCLRE